MYNYYKIEEQHVEQVSKYLMEEEIPFTTVSDPVIYVCENELDKYIEQQEEELKPLFRKIEDDLVYYMSENYNNNSVISLGFTNLIVNGINEIVEGE